MRELNDQELAQVSGGFTPAEGIGAMGVVAAAAALAPITAVGAGVILAGVAGAATVSAMRSYFDL
ncbi:class IIb bacteriocin, lactobin A/cerein 7B family [Pantoea ananatis]|uniref:class IIb bacteriocin, lactobin A/cerein 7B family n=1 Tax=Pantoea ananas TaxID=553 RepID=UPI00092F1038|nr:class IIb bacteriocin, lactobin A/cerein 7B family [Pantoea ananatis]MDS7722091.1 class IIb bacteriocin, lactobin A/cerein 7B family [Pantoea ananatis]PZD66888.1 class IIb bacteriocin, lactobin A/cerein 7B family [Pantoea ananatis]